MDSGSQLLVIQPKAALFTCVTMLEASDASDILAYFQESGRGYFLDKIFLDNFNLQNSPTTTAGWGIQEVEDCTA